MSANPPKDQSAVTLNTWAAARQAEGDLMGALTGFGAAVAAGIEEFGKDSPTVAILLNNLATVQLEIGNHQEALEEYLMAEQIDRAAYGPIHAKVGDRVYRVGIAYDRLGNHEAARACYEEAFLTLLRTRGVKGEDTMNVAFCLLGLQGDPVRAARSKGAPLPVLNELISEFRRIAAEQSEKGGLVEP